MYSTYDVQSGYQKKIGTLAPTASRNPSIFTFALGMEIKTSLLVATDQAGSGRVMIEHGPSVTWQAEETKQFEVVPTSEGRKAAASK